MRAGINDIDVFNEEELKYGACCFYTEDRVNKYFFKMKGQEATLYMNSKLYIDEAIDEFLFYSGFIKVVRDSNGSILKKREVSSPYLMEILKIRPSQFYINEKKLKNCKLWIKEQKDIMIPISIIEDKAVSLDGHTRLMAAYDLGYDSVYVYHEECGKYIYDFVKEATEREILNILDMKIIGDEEYKLKWHNFCDEFFAKIK